MEEKSVIIIGAGLAGLSAGCYAQMNHYQSHIFEHHTNAGGLAAAWRRGDYLIDGGIHFLIAHKPGSDIYDVYRELGAVHDGQCVEMGTYMRFTDEETGSQVDFSADLDRLAADLKRLSPEDSDRIDKLIDATRELRDSPLLMEMGMGVPPELKGRIGYLKEIWSMRGFFKFFVGDLSKPVAEYTRSMHNPLVGKILESLFSADGPVWFVAMILASVAAGQLGLLKGGCPGFVQPIEQRYKALGGKVSYSSTVEKILVEDDRAVGVRLADGSEHRADAVVSAADGYGTIFKMLDGRFTSKSIDDQYSTWKMYSPIVMISFGVARTFTDTPPLSMFLLRRPLKLGPRTVDSLPLRVLNYSSEFAPPGKTVIQVMLETDWKHWSDLHQNQSLYEAEKERIVAEVLDRLEGQYPGLKSQVEMKDVATPYSTWRYTLNREGSPMGWLMTSKTMMAQVPRRLPGLGRFYMAGQWVLPGGGVPPCIYSGRHAIQILCHDDGRLFRTSIP